MTTTGNDVRATAVGRPALGPYLQAVAGALAMPDATTEGVLRAAEARDVRRVVSVTKFRTPDQRVVDAFIKLPSDRDSDQHPQSVDFRFDSQGMPVTLPELERTFGAWRGDLAGTNAADPYQVEFVHAYPPELEAARPRGPLTFVRVSLSGDPHQAGVRVRRVLLTRFSANPG